MIPILHLIKINKFGAELKTRIFSTITWKVKKLWLDEYVIKMQFRILIKGYLQNIFISILFVNYPICVHGQMRHKKYLQFSENITLKFKECTLKIFSCNEEVYNFLLCKRKDSSWKLKYLTSLTIYKYLSASLHW